MTDGLAHALQGTFGAPRAYGILPRTVDVTKLLACLGPIERTVRSLVHGFADVGWLDVVTDVGLVRVVQAAKDPDVERALDDVASTPLANESGFRWKRSNVEVDATLPCRDHVDVLRALRARSFLRESLVSQDSVLGVLTLALLPSVAPAAGAREAPRFGLRDHRTLEACARGLAYLVATKALAD
jgi:hypothetical protein